MPRKVYVPNRGPHDYSPAAAFGELVYCTDGPISRFDTAQMYRELSAAMHDSEADDYLLLTSLSSLCCVAAAILAARHKRVNLLIYNPDQRDYVERSIHLT